MSKSYAKMIKLRLTLLLMTSFSTALSILFLFRITPENILIRYCTDLIGIWFALMAGANVIRIMKDSYKNFNL